MPKRDHDTDIWLEDWFLNLNDSEMLFWFYIKDRCDHAGFWRPNFKMFENSTGRRINQDDFLKKINAEKPRIKVLENGRWFICGFIAFQYCGKLNIANRFHKSVLETFRKNISCENTVDYGFEVCETSKRPQLEVNKERRLENKKRRIKKEEKGIEGERKEIENEDEGMKNIQTPDYLKAAMVGFIENRKGLRKPLGDNARSLIIEKLERLYPGDHEKQVECLNQSTENGWQGVFAIKSEQPTNGKRYGRREVTIDELREQAKRVKLS